MLPVFAICGSLVLLANLGGALPENTNAPGELTCGRAPCHNIPFNAGDAQISIAFNFGDSTYLADSTYTVAVKIQNPMTARNGFQIVALKQNNQNAGTWQLTAPDTMKIISGISFPNRKYVTHKAAGNLQTEWTMRWKAPAAGAGKITFYASVLSANNNGMNTGDEVYTTKTEVNFVQASALGEAWGDEFRVYPVPATDGIWVEAPAWAEDLRLSLFNSDGIPETVGPDRVGNRFFVKTDGLAGGMYFLEIKSGQERAVKKVVVF